jgi:glycosyltransferase involved in cell wall biosynthesis
MPNPVSPLLAPPEQAALALRETSSGSPPHSARAGQSVLLVVEPGLDGVFRHVEGLVAFLQSRGVRIHLAYSSRRSGSGMVALVERVRTAGGQTLDLCVSNVPELGDGPSLGRLLGLIRRVRPDVIHAHSSKAGALARTAAVLLRHPHCLYTPHAYYGMAKPPSLKVVFFNWVEKAIGRIGLTVAISEDEASFARSTLGVDADRISIIHNPVDASRFAPPSGEQRRAARKRLGLVEHAVVLATIGRMCWQKDPETAYAAVAPVAAENPDLHFLHLGWGKWKKYLLGYSRRLGFGSQLSILDYVDDPRSIYHAADALLVSSRYEAGWPLVLLEAMASNLPVIASTCLGMSDVGRAGLSHLWTFAPEKTDECTKAVRQWLETHRRGIHDCNHRDFAIERLSPERCYGALFDLYHSGSSVRTVSPMA